MSHSHSGPQDKPFMTPPPDFSIVMPTLNQAEFLCEAIDSVLSQRTADLSLQLIVMDGGSTDNTLDLLASYGSDIVVNSGKDSGQSDAVNRGLAMATGKISGWLNSDDVLKPRALSRVLDMWRTVPVASDYQIDGVAWPSAILNATLWSGE